MNITSFYLNIKHFPLRCKKSLSQPHIMLYSIQNIWQVFFSDVYQATQQATLPIESFISHCNSSFYFLCVSHIITDNASKIFKELHLFNLSPSRLTNILFFSLSIIIDLVFLLLIFIPKSLPILSKFSSNPANVLIFSASILCHQQIYSSHKNIHPFLSCTFL